MLEKRCIMNAEKELYKKNIIDVVEAYKKIFPAEYMAVVQIVKDNRKNQNKKTGAFNGNIDTLDRALSQYPETLLGILQNRLSPNEMLWFTNTEGARWFANQYKEFSLAEKI